MSYFNASDEKIYFPLNYISTNFWALQIWIWISECPEELRQLLEGASQDFIDPGNADEGSGEK